VSRDGLHQPAHHTAFAGSYPDDKNARPHRRPRRHLYEQPAELAPDDPARRGELKDYVLDEFGKREAAVVRDLMPTLTEALELWLTSGITPVMNKFTGETI
jgi:hypothetical protein